MTSYRITKYNPVGRNEQGNYLDNSEWTAIGDIGKAEYNYITYEQYEKVESAYVTGVKAIMKDNNLDFLTVDSLELRDKKQDFNNHAVTGRLKNINVDYDKDIKSLKNGLRLNLEQIDKIIRLILRETIWLLLVNDNFEVRFGYDYYMYVKCKHLEISTIRKIEKNGLFVENEIKQRKIIATD